MPRASDHVWGVFKAQHLDGVSLRVSEIFASLQGEGPTAGLAATFLRLAHCNLDCAWCDTRYAWDFTRYDLHKETKLLGVTPVAERIFELGLPRLVITGGEPLIQQGPLGQLLEILPFSLYIEVETNGTLVPSPTLLAEVDQWNVSPKLSNAGMPRERRIVLSSLAAFRDSQRAYLKLVVADAEDLTEADALVEELGWPCDRVVLMPEATTPKQLEERRTWLLPAAEARSQRYSTRLQVERFGNQRGK